MFSRLIAVVLALFLLWSGVAAAGAVTALTPAPAEPHSLTADLAVNGPATPALPAPLAEYLPDDAAAPPQSEPAAEPSGFLPPGHVALPGALPGVATHPFRTSSVRPPFLAGPLRPPCGGTRAT